MGFARAGIAPAEPTTRRMEYLDWLQDGRHGDMGYLAEMLEERLDVGRLLPGARSVIVVADQYAARGAAEHEANGNTAEGVVAKYARGRDYHAVIKKRLHALCDRLREEHPGAKFRAFTDTGPAMEREHAVRAGIGFVGKHTLVIEPRLGSYLLLGGVATTLEMLERAGGEEKGGSGGAPEAWGGKPVPHQGTDHCGSCTACIDACPTRAITPYRVDAARCVSYLTLEHRGVIDASLHAGVGDRLIGCDACQDVCPFNRRHEDDAMSDGRVNAAYADDSGVRARLPILDVIGWTEQDRSRVFGPSAGKRASVAMLRRNALVIAGNALSNHADAELLGQVRVIAVSEDEEAVVRETAQQVLARISST